MIQSLCVATFTMIAIFAICTLSACGSESPNTQHPQADVLSDSAIEPDGKPQSPYSDRP